MHVYYMDCSFTGKNAKTYLELSWDITSNRPISLVFDKNQ